eukprot:COSAG03_NODE_210_length_10594_cov_32.990472_3_plen_73_part_00
MGGRAEMKLSSVSESQTWGCPAVHILFAERGCLSNLVNLEGCIVIVVLNTVAIAWGDGSSDLECDATFGWLF